MKPTITKQLDGRYEVATLYQDGYERTYYPTFAKAVSGLTNYNYIDLTVAPVVVVEPNGNCTMSMEVLRQATQLALHKKRLDSGCSYSVKVVFTKVEELFTGEGI